MLGNYGLIHLHPVTGESPNKAYIEQMISAV
jgi:hypothetical protein